MSHDPFWLVDKKSIIWAEKFEDTIYTFQKN